jgi:hypothetical protein
MAGKGQLVEVVLPSIGALLSVSMFAAPLKAVLRVRHEGHLGGGPSSAHLACDC